MSEDTLQQPESGMERKSRKAEPEPAANPADNTAEGGTGQALAVSGFKAKSEKFLTDYIEGTRLDKYVAKVDNTIGFLLAKEDHTIDNEALAASSSPIRAGMWLFLIVFVFGGLWAACAPITSAAVATGKVVIDSNKKSIAHMQGGIVAEFMVKEGDVVKKGDPLVRLDDTQAKAAYDIYTSQMRTALAAEARLKAERDSADTIVFPEEIWKLGDEAEVQKVIDSESKLFDYRRRAVNGEVDVLNQRVKQFEDEIKALESQEKAAGDQLRLINEEISTVNKLMEKGQALKPRLLQLKRAAAELEGQRGQHLAMIARAGQSIGENQIAILNLTNENMSKVVDELKKTQSQIADLRERITATRDTLERILITAPDNGRVTGLEFHTVGGVIPPNSTILFIVPQEEQMTVEAYILPQDIDVVTEGLDATVRLTAYKVRTVPTIEGKVTYVSADRFDDPKSNTSYYKAYIKLDKVYMDKLASHIELKPGMPAEVHIVTGHKTPLSYLFDPLTNYFGRAWKEQ